MNPKDITIADYDYPLPDERIAKFPLPERDQSKLLILRDGTLAESRFFNLPERLPSNALLVFNDTKVIHARLIFRKSTGAAIEVFCLEPHQMPVAQAFEQRSHVAWNCFVGNNKRWRDAEISRHLIVGGKETTLTATRREAVGNAWVVDFDWEGGFTFAEVIQEAGVIPLPPYLHREAVDSDSERYQTVYAHSEGSVAAPTAGLHFTDAVFSKLKEKGIATEFITLHVGAGTFKPVNSDTIGEHEMHVEKVQVSQDNLERFLAYANRPLFAVGTTTVRTLESLYWFGVKLSLYPGLEEMRVSQWDPYELADKALPKNESFENVARFMRQKGLSLLNGDTQLLIAPGYQYRVIDGLITNFHQPKSTLLLLVSALIGEKWRECYQYALDHDFRFLSYGDSCLFFR
ncbi:MAG: S-adenosylmethionine:tRNA ribosyltransferase-isomerase [Bacteroidales bacterium]|nr:S-adenosylmethionine:tRNA ribosyltransferase-isomerase [Bacteroidales bacterium]